MAGGLWGAGVSAALVLCATCASAAPEPAALASGLAGHWSGALGYRDYRTDKPSELPVKTDIRALDDGATVIRVSGFDDGPKAGVVYITTSSLFDAKAGVVISSSLRKARAPEFYTEQVRVAAFTDPQHWTLVYERTGPDGDGEASIRVTETRDGASLLTVKEVRPLTSADGAWLFRNQTRLARDPAP